MGNEVALSRLSFSQFSPPGGEGNCEWVITIAHLAYTRQPIADVELSACTGGIQNRKSYRRSVAVADHIADHPVVIQQWFSKCRIRFFPRAADELVSDEHSDWLVWEKLLFRRTFSQ